MTVDPSLMQTPGWAYTPRYALGMGYGGGYGGEGHSVPRTGIGRRPCYCGDGRFGDAEEILERACEMGLNIYSPIIPLFTGDSVADNSISIARGVASHELDEVGRFSLIVPIVYRRVVDVVAWILEVAAKGPVYYNHCAGSWLVEPS